MKYHEMREKMDRESINRDEMHRMRYGREYQPGKGDSLDFRQLAGIILIVLGLIMALWLFISVFHVLGNADGVGVFEKMIPRSMEERTLRINNENVIIPEFVFVFLSYLITVFLLSIAGTIAGKVISGGVKVLQPDFKDIGERMLGKMSELGDNIKDAIARKTGKQE